MAQMLISLIDHPGAPLSPQRGDVIAAQEDGAAWGAAEMGNLDWRILSVPGAVADWTDLAGMQRAIAPDGPRFTGYRAAYLDLDDARLATDPRACVRLRPAAPGDPADIGGHPSLLGE